MKRIASTPNARGQGKPFFREMTAAHLRERKGAEHMEVVFLESARFYRLPKAQPSFDRILGLLRDAVAKRCVLKVQLASPDSDVIEDVHVS